MYDRVDVVFDFNNGNSLIESTRDIQPTALYLSIVDNDTTLPSTNKLFENFLKNLNSRQQFCKLLETNLIDSLHCKKNVRFHQTDTSVIIFNNTTDYKLADVQSVTTCREDVNARLILHVENAVHNGHSNICIMSSDANGIVVAVYAFKYLLPTIYQSVVVRNEG